MSHIVIIGAGVTGVTTAYALRQRGFQVTVIDRHRYAAMETSYANGGQLSVSNAEVWNRWATVLKGVKWMFRANAPLLMNPRPSWHKYSWLGAFVRQIPHYEANTTTTVRLALAARQHLFDIAEREGIDFDCERRGILHFYTNPASLKGARIVNPMLVAGGLERYPVTTEELHEIEPALKGEYVGGFYTPSDATGDIHKYTTGLAAACARHGVGFIHEAEVQTIAQSSFGVVLSWRRMGEEVMETLRANALVVCAGVRSRDLAQMLGDHINIYPVKGYSITVNMDDETSVASAPWVSLLDDDAKIVTSRLGAGRLRVAGTAEFNGINFDIRADRIQPLVNWTRKHFPGVETEKVVPWAGLRPMMPTMLPKVGPGRHPNVFYNTGHGHLGWTLAAATSVLIADEIQAAMPADSSVAA
jgi:D-amino-acid dehydrogenase